MEIGRVHGHGHHGPIGNIHGDPDIEFAKARLRAHGRYVDPRWTEQELFHQLQLLDQAIATTTTVVRMVRRDTARQQADDAALWSRQTHAHLENHDPIDPALPGAA